MPLYFAYGSNLLTQRLQARCASARVVATGTFKGHRLAFAKYSHVDGSGKATILPAEGVDTDGALFELPEGELRTLDDIEGVGRGYDRATYFVNHPEGGSVPAQTYIASTPDEAQCPFDWYLALIIAGCLQHHLPVTGLRGSPAVCDPDQNRPGFRTAVSALAAAGHHDWQKLLEHV